MNQYQVIRRPLITEKGVAMKESDRTVCFQVAATATKTVIREAVEKAHEAYCILVEGLMSKYAGMQDKTLRRQMAREAARSVLPNATETKIFVTANARALRHFIELRCNEHAEVEIRKVAGQVLRLLRREAPNLFGDYEFVELPDGTQAARTIDRSTLEPMGEYLLEGSPRHVQLFTLRAWSSLVGVDRAWAASAAGTGREPENDGADWTRWGRARNGQAHFSIRRDNESGHRPARA